MNWLKTTSSVITMIHDSGKTLFTISGFTSHSVDLLLNLLSGPILCISDLFRYPSSAIDSAS